MCSQYHWLGLLVADAQVVVVPGLCLTDLFSGVTNIPIEVRVRNLWLTQGLGKTMSVQEQSPPHVNVWIELRLPGNREVKRVLLSNNAGAGFCVKGAA